jgi:hypothetical protein
MKTGKGVACPICGYDQRGAVAAWTDSCPLEGTCSECGHVFEWAALLSRRVRDEMELFDCATRLRGYSFVYTILVIVRPWRLWSVAAARFSLRRTAAVSTVALLFWAVGVATITQLVALIAYPIVHLFWPGDDYPDEWVYPAVWLYGIWDESSMVAVISWGILAGLLFLIVATFSMPLLTLLSDRSAINLRSIARITLLTVAGFPIVLLPGALLGIAHEAAWDIYWHFEAYSSPMEDSMSAALSTYEFVRGATDMVLLSAWISACWLLALRRNHNVHDLLAHILLLTLTLTVLLFLAAMAYVTMELLL